MSDILLQATELGVHTITLNRPDIRNAFDDGLIAKIHEAFEAVSRREDVRCVVLAANGPAFCAGGDLLPRHIRSTAVQPRRGRCAHQRAAQPARVHAR